VQKLKVLLLDDQEDFRDVVRDYLISRFYEVTEASNGAEGLRAIMRDTFDLIICDMMMPKVGGEMFYWAVTRVRPAARLRFIFITGYQNDPKVDHFFRRIQATVLLKPFKLEELNASLLDVDRKLR
jgi:CheY-like chemotaxis protein